MLQPRSHYYLPNQCKEEPKLSLVLIISEQGNNKCRYPSSSQWNEKPKVPLFDIILINIVMNSVIIPHHVTGKNDKMCHFPITPE